MSTIHDAHGVRLIYGNVREVATTATITDGSVRSIVTSPPYYGLRDYGEDEQLGAEASVREYVDNLVGVFGNLRRVLADDGTVWLNLGDSYARNPAKGFTGTMNGRNEPRQGYAGGSLGGLTEKNLIGVPWRVAFALQDDGWVLRSDIIWAKPNPMPESVTDRPTKAHEYLFLFAKNPRYYYDADAIQETAVGGAKGSRFDTGKTAEHQLGRAQEGERERPQLRRAIVLAREKGLTDDHLAAIRAVGKNKPEVQRLADEAKAALGGYYREFLTGGDRNKRTVWTVPTVPFPGSHFAVYPPELIRPCIRAGSAIGDTILDPFSGSGTTGMVARQEGRNYIGIDLNREYLDLSLRTRFAQPVMDIWNEVAS